MKITKAEKIWLAAVIIFYACYNLPFVPPYGMAKATIIHGLITLVPLWIAIYVGFAVICRIYRIRDQAGDDTDLTDTIDKDGNPAGDTPVSLKPSPAPAQEARGAMAEDIPVPVKPSPIPAQERDAALSGGAPVKNSGRNDS